MLLTVCDRDGYGIYNEERSIYHGEFVWEYNNGDIKNMYSAFRDRGIVFENDIYGKLAEQDRKLLQMCREKNYLIWESSNWIVATLFIFVKL